MIDFSEIANNLSDFLSEKQKPLLISCILILFFCVALAVIAFVPQKKQSDSPVFVEKPLEADQELLLPQSPSVPQSYAVSREQKDRWDSAQVEKWFTVPDEQAVEKLSQANDDMISNITGGAP